jgi:hypothetical protein
LSLPRRDRFGDPVWKKPTVAAILAIPRKRLRRSLKT